MWTYSCLLCFVFALQATGQDYGRRRIIRRKLPIPKKAMYPGGIDGGLANAAAQIADNVVAAQNIAHAAAQSANIAHSIAKDTAHIAAKVGVGGGSGVVFPTGGIIDPVNHQIGKHIVHKQAKTGGTFIPIYPNSAAPIHPKPFRDPLGPSIDPFGHRIEKQIVHDQMKRGGMLPPQKPMMPIHPKPAIPIHPKPMGGGLGAALMQVGGIGRDAPWMKDIIGKDIDMGGQIMVGGHNKWPRHGGAGGGEIFANGLRDGWGGDGKVPMVAAVSNWRSPMGGAPIPLDYAGGPLPGLASRAGAAAIIAEGAAATAAAAHSAGKSAAFAHGIAKDTTHIAAKSGVIGVGPGFGGMGPGIGGMGPGIVGMGPGIGGIGPGLGGMGPGIGGMGPGIGGIGPGIGGMGPGIGGMGPGIGGMGPGIGGMGPVIGGPGIGGMGPGIGGMGPGIGGMGPGIGGMGPGIGGMGPGIGGMVPGALFPTNPLIDPVEHGMMKQAGHIAQKTIGPPRVDQFTGPLHNVGKQIVHNQMKTGGIIDPVDHQIRKHIVHKQVKSGGTFIPLYPKSAIPMHPKPNLPFHPKPLGPNIQPFGHQIEKQIVHDQIKTGGPMIHPKPAIPIHPKPMGGGLRAALMQVGGVGRDAPWMKDIIGKDIDMGGQIMVGGHNKWPRHGGAGGGEIFANGLRDGWGGDGKVPMVAAVSNWRSPMGGAPIPLDYTGGPLPGLASRAGAAAIIAEGAAATAAAAHSAGMSAAFAHGIAKDTTHIAAKSGVIGVGPGLGGMGGMGPGIGGMGPGIGGMGPGIGGMGPGLGGMGPGIGGMGPGIGGMGPGIGGMGPGLGGMGPGIGGMGPGIGGMGPGIGGMGPGIGGMVPGALFPTDPLIDPVEHGMMKQAGHIAQKTIGPPRVDQFTGPLHNVGKQIVHNQVKTGGIIDPVDHQIGKHIVHKQVKSGGTFIPLYPKSAIPMHPKPNLPFHPKPLGPNIQPFGHQIEKQIVHDQIKTGGPMIHPKPAFPIHSKPMGGGLGAALMQVGGVGRGAPWLKDIIGKDIDMGGQIMVGGHNKWPRHGGAGGGEIFANGLRDGWGGDGKVPMVAAVSNWRSPIGSAPIPLDYAGGLLPGMATVSGAAALIAEGVAATAAAAHSAGKSATVAHGIAKDTAHIAAKSGVMAGGMGLPGRDPVTDLGHNIAKGAMHSAAKTVDFGTHGALSGGDPFARQVARDMAQEAIQLAAQTVAMSPGIGKVGVLGQQGGLGLYGGKPKPVLPKNLPVHIGKYPKRRW